MQNYDDCKVNTEVKEINTVTDILKQTEEVFFSLNIAVRRLDSKLKGEVACEPGGSGCCPIPPEPGVIERAETNLKRAYDLHSRLESLVDRL